MMKFLKILKISIFFITFSNLFLEAENKNSFDTNTAEENNEKSFVGAVVTDFSFWATLSLVGYLGYKLYPDIVKDNRNTIFGISSATILSLYFARKYASYVSSGNNFENDQSNDYESKLEKMTGNNFEDDQSNDCESKLEKMTESGVRVYLAGEIKENFSNVAGLKTAKNDLQDIKNFLENPKKFRDIGAKVPKGVLMNGAPGNGKTLLARALAGEVGCPFLYITGTEFSEMFVGVGAARVRDLFEVAREYAPCIIFIDEIDTIGHKRSSFGNSLGHTDSQTLNQLLAEMDGFEQNQSPIIVIGATNRADVLDEALLRPGRFDRKIEILSPFFKDRCELLNLALKKVRASDEIDVSKVAMATIGFSGAELTNLINEAALLAVRENTRKVTMDHIDQARDYILLGRETKGMDIVPKEAWVTAIHEAGHALMHVYQKDALALYKVTITPRGGALGLTFGMPVKEKYSKNDLEMKAEINVCLGGSVAEEIIFGHQAAGASSDLVRARRIATEMVMCYGMTESFKDVSFMEFIYKQNHLPDQIATQLHEAVAKIIAECRKKTQQLLLDHKDILINLAKKLMDEGTVLGSDVYKLCNIQEPGLVYSLV